MKKISGLTLVFSILFTVFFLLLIFFRIPFPLYHLMSYQDVSDLLTPLVLIPIYWLMFRASSAKETSQRGEIIFIILAAIWILGHGVHLAANSIDNLIENLAKNQELDITGTDIYALTYFLDENLSHYLWHGAILGLTAFLSISEWRSPVEAKTNWWLTTIAGIIYGFATFCVFNEGQTVFLGFPFAILFTLITIIWLRKLLPNKPIIAFFFIASLVTVVLFIGWGLYWGGFPEFTEVGLI